MEPIFKPCPTFPHLRVSRDGEIQSCLSIGPSTRMTENWRALKVSRNKKYGPHPTVSVSIGKKRVEQVPVHEIVESTWGPQSPLPQWPTTARIVNGMWTF
jgi:hypothetical protein